LIKLYALYTGKKREGGTPCNEGTRVWRDRWLEIKFTNVHPKTGTKKIASNKRRDNWTKMSQCLI
jgi:hypothetical protein